MTFAPVADVLVSALAEVDDGLGEGVWSLLRQVVADAVRRLRLGQIDGAVQDRPSICNSTVYELCPRKRPGGGPEKSPSTRDVHAISPESCASPVI